jgi:membrane protein implicated in regulation of membrane protease activity
VEQPLRLTGLAIVVLGALLAIVSRAAALPMPAWIDTVIFATLAIGWAILIYVIYRRTQYNRRRMAGR